MLMNNLWKGGQVMKLAIRLLGEMGHQGVKPKEFIQYAI
jgi:hypothetical protein